MKMLRDEREAERYYKILYFLDNFQALGGAANTLLRQMALMHKAGMAVAAVLSANEGEGCFDGYIRFCEKERIQIFSTDYTVSTQPEDIDIYAVINDYDNVKKLIEEFRPDILHSVQMNPTVELAGRELQIPHVMNIYPAVPEFFRLDYMDIFPRYHICDSFYYAKVWEKYLHTRSFCVRTAAERLYGSKKTVYGAGKIRFLCVGTIYREKNQLSAIEAVDRALAEGINGELYLYGYADSPYADMCRQYVKNNHLQERIFFAGFCDDMRSVYQNSDVLLCASMRESYPNVISEALAYGLTVISTPAGGIPEVMKDRVNGFLCSGYSADDIFGKIVEYYQCRQSGELGELLEKADETYRREHSPDMTARRLRNIYAEVLEDACLSVNMSGPRTDTVRSAFWEELAAYRENVSFFTDAKAVRRKLWYLHYIKKVITGKYPGKYVPVYIWGAGRNGRNVYEMVRIFLPQVEIIGYMDSSVTGSFCGMAVYPADEVLEKNEAALFFIALMNEQKEVCEILEQRGRRYCEDYFILAPRRW